MIFAKTEINFKQLAIGSPTVKWGISENNYIFNLQSKPSGGTHWQLMPGLPDGQLPGSMDCAADGTVMIHAASSSNDIFQWMGTYWKYIQPGFYAQNKTLSVGNCNNTVVCIEGNEVWQYRAPYFAKKLLGPNMAGIGGANLCATSTDGTTVLQVIDPQTLNVTLQQRFDNNTWATIVSGRDLPAKGLSVFDGQSIFFIDSGDNLSEYVGNQVLVTYHLKQWEFIEKKGKYGYQPIPGKLVGINAGTERQMAIVMQDAEGKHTSYLSIPRPMKHVLPHAIEPDDLIKEVHHMDLKPADSKDAKPAAKGEK